MKLSTVNKYLNHGFINKVLAAIVSIFAILYFGSASSLAESMPNTKANASPLISITNTLQKLIFAGTAYEIIKVFRRFSRK